MAQPAATLQVVVPPAPTLTQIYAALQVVVPPAAVAITHGGFGVVVLGTHTPTNAAVAVKKQKVADGLHEATILQQLHGMGPHANIVGFVGHHVEGPSAFLVTEAAHHEWYDELPSRDNGLTDLPPLAQSQVRFAQALAGVAYMHACGIVHLDLKLENIMVRADGSLVLIDFGHSQVLPANAPPPVLTNFKGTQRYVAPDVWLGAYDGVKSDIWSLGVCLFTACAGFFPFDNAHCTVGGHTFGGIYFPPDQRFQRAQQTQANVPPSSTVEALFALYGRPCPFPQPLTDLLDGLLLIDEQTRLNVDQAIASPWVQALYAPGVMPVPLPVAPPPPQPPQVPLPVAPPPPQQVVALADIHDQAMASAAEQTLAALAVGGFDTGSEPGGMSVTDAGSSEQMGAAEYTDLSAEPTSPTSPPPKFRCLGHGDSDDGLAAPAPPALMRQRGLVFLRG